MRNIKEIAGQRGTLLMEAIAMLGLIAMVTPTLYKKSAERMQEIQDINIAGQARNMDHIISSFIYNHISDLKSDSDGIEPGGTIKLCYTDDGDGCFKYGYSSYVPAGYTPRNLKTYGEPHIYVYRYGAEDTNGRDSFVYYILYPNLSNQDEKRAARVASLVGANGGTVSDRNGDLEIYGTGGGWGLDSSLIGDETGKVNIPEDMLIKNSLVITSQEPVTAEMLDSEVFLYRKQSEEAGKNMMHTSLYMGGTQTEEAGTQRMLNSIYNVRKLTLNTKCDAPAMRAGTADVSTIVDEGCPAAVADLYIGKPILDTTTPDQALNGVPNTGAAWIYGNLSALNANFRLIKGSNSETESTPDEMMFGRYDSSGTSSNVFYAVNGNGGERVSLINNFVQAQNGTGESSRIFMVGDSSDAFIGVYENSSTVRINSPVDGVDDGARVTMINKAGGIVYIGDRTEDSDVPSEVYINNNGGLLSAGKNASWIQASADEAAEAKVYILKDKGGEFGVGASSKAGEYFMWADSSVVGLNQGQIQVFTPKTGSINMGPLGGATLVSAFGGSSDVIGNGATAILSGYTDILGSTYLGAGDLVHTGEVLGEGETFTRSGWNLAVAGSAYVDSTLAAYEAWFHRSGFKDLHAGFSSFSEWKNGTDEDKKKATLNVYDDHLVIRNRASGIDGDNLGDFGASSASGVLMYADSTQIRLQDTHGAALDMTGGLAQFGAAGGMVAADSTQVSVYTTDDSAVVNIQKGGMVFSKQPEVDTAVLPTNTIKARAGEFGIQTLNNTLAYTTNHDGAQFYVNGEETGVRNVEFKVGLDKENYSTAAFYVAPYNIDPTTKMGTTVEGSATVNINGSLHVKGNRVIHIASDSSNAIEEGSLNHAMMEINPDFVQVFAKNSSSGEVNKEHKVLKVNPYDVGGAESEAADKEKVGVYIRRGAIELEQSDSSEIGAPHAANAGYGYILANRFVYNGGMELSKATRPAGYTDGTAYDQYMVNPAYTSVMHDIKLTTRGGARLSDILPDYVLKGVYNLSNNCKEGTTEDTVNCDEKTMNFWAAPYVGIIPYESCPPGYLNMVTIMPISFNVGRAGRLVTEDRGGSKVVVGSAKHQADILNGANGLENIVYPGMVDVSSYVYNGIYQGESSFSWSSYASSRPEGWFLGFKAPLNASGLGTDARLEAVDATSGQYWKYKASSSVDFMPVAEPLYFQQNTWLKTTVDPENGTNAKGWKAYMGFIYDVNEWGSNLGGDIAPIGSIFEKGGSSNILVDKTNFRWNMFPVPTNTIEGHAMVYCYFDRKSFKDWKDSEGGQLVDQIDQLGSLKGEADAPGYREVGKKPDNDYTKRLHDSTLKYSDPW